LKRSNFHSSGNVALLTKINLYMNRKRMWPAMNVICHIENESLPVTSSHVHCKMVMWQGRDNFTVDR